MRKNYGKVRKVSNARKLRRKLSIRKKVVGTVERPRICASKSNTNLYVQVIDDTKGVTVCSVQTFGKDGLNCKANKDGAKLVGESIAKQMKDKGLSVAVFDRNGASYHGVIATLANSIRENGIRI